MQAVPVAAGCFFTVGQGFSLAVFAPPVPACGIIRITGLKPCFYDKIFLLRGSYASSAR